MLSHVSFEFRENDSRYKEKYFFIKNKTNDHRYVAVLTGKYVADIRVLNWLSSSKSNAEYFFNLIKLIDKTRMDDTDFLKALVKPNNYVHDYYFSNRTQRKEIDQMARLQIAATKWGESHVNSLHQNELLAKINTISDEEVREFLKNVKSDASNH